jgi:hypothetical protein
MPAKKQKPVTEEAIPPKNNGTKTIIWVAVGCLGISLIIGLILLGIFVWGMWKMKEKIEKTNYAPYGQQLDLQNDRKVYPPENSYATDLSDNLNQNLSGQAQENFTETPPAEEGFLPPTTTEKNMGYIKKVYVKNGKNYLDTDYIQWLTGTEAEKALREDGQCPKTGECIVYDDYYIRNQNPLVRTFEIAPDAAIIMQTLDSETTGDVNQNKKITIDQLKNIFAPGSSHKDRYQLTPFIVEISNKQIVKINEQYIP